MSLLHLYVVAPHSTEFIYTLLVETSDFKFQLFLLNKSISSLQSFTCIEICESQ